MDMLKAQREGGDPEKIKEEFDEKRKELRQQEREKREAARRAALDDDMVRVTFRYVTTKRVSPRHLRTQATRVFTGFLGLAFVLL